MATSKETIADTMTMLHERLRRIDYALNGDDTQLTEQGQTRSSASARLRTLERTLHSLTTRSPAAADILALQNARPALFAGDSPDEVPSTLSASSLAALVVAHAQLYTSVSSQLTQLQDNAVPGPGPVVKLVDLQPRIDKAVARHEQQAREVAELRARSARVVERWYEVGVLEMGERWVDWEERIREVEILVRRREAAMKREEGVV